VVATGIGATEGTGFRSKVSPKAGSAPRPTASEDGPSSGGPVESAPSVPTGEDYAGFDRPAFERNRPKFGRAGSRSDSGLDVPTFLRRQMD
jgi:hypothetical protein